MKLTIMKYKIIIVLLFGILGCAENSKDQPLSATVKEREIDKIQLKDLNDQPINLSNYKGKTIFINFWATWCKSCIVEMPSIERAQNKLGNQGVVFLLASNESAEEIKAFTINHDYKLNFIRIENSEALNIQALPATFIFSREGKLVFSEVGYRTWDDKNNIDMISKIANKNE